MYIHGERTYVRKYVTYFTEAEQKEKVRKLEQLYEVIDNAPDLSNEEVARFCLAKASADGFIVDMAAPTDSELEEAFGKFCRAVRDEALLESLNEGGNVTNMRKLGQHIVAWLLILGDLGFKPLP